MSTHKLFYIRIRYFSSIRIKEISPCHISYHNKIMARGILKKKISTLLEGNKPMIFFCLVFSFFFFFFSLEVSI